MDISEELRSIAEALYQERASWPELIKKIRRATGLGIFAAEKIALSHEGWRRLCTHRINNDPVCRKLAVQHIKFYGAASLIVMVGESFAIVAPEAP
nr:hypothetical protein [uncultured Shinella sp.]